MLDTLPAEALDETALPPEALEETALPTENLEGSSTRAVSAMDETLLPDEDHPSGPTRGGAEEGESSLKRGDALGRYVVLELLGKGGMGEVYAAYDPTLDRKVALKVLRPSLGSAETVTTARARLTREAQAMAQLADPNVIQVFDVGTVGGDVYIAMEFVEGASLRDWLSEEREMSEILRVFRSAAAGLAAAHKAGMVHRDFKPDNVLIGKDGRVRVIDFGIASLGGDDTSSSDEIIERLTRSRRSVEGAYTTLTGVAAGTPAYMAPEQFTGKACDARTDQFSFSIALYEALCGERPFEGANIAELLTNVTEGKRRPTPESGDVPQWIHTALTRALMAPPDKRFDSMDELIRALTPPGSWMSRNWVPVTMLATLALGGLLAMVLMQPGSTRPSCAEDETLLTGIWDATRAQELQAKFGQSSLAYASVTGAKIVEHLDAHAGRWQEARKNLCLAAVRRDISPEIKDRGMACLDRRLRELDAVSTILSRGTDEIIKDSPVAVSELSSVSDCTNTTLLATGGDALSPAWAEIADQFPELKAMFVSSQYQQLLEQATRLRTLAEERGFGRGEAEALTWVANAERALSMYGSSEEHFFEAVRIAQKEGSPRVRAIAWQGLMGLATADDRPKEGLRWFKHAEIANEQAGVDPELQARLTYLQGFSYYKLQEYEQALGRFEASAALYEKVYDPEHWRVSSSLAIAGASLRQLGRFNDALAITRRALSIAISSLGPEHPRLASIHNGLANTLGRLMKFDEAREHYKEAQRLVVAANGERHASVGMYLYNRANLELRAGRFEEALDLGKRARELRAEKLGDGHAAVMRAISGIATAHFRLGDLDRAVELQTDVVKRYQLRNGDEHVVTGQAHSELCNYLRRGKKLKQARESCNEALGILDPDAPDQRDLALALTYAAWIDVDKGESENALARAQKAWGLRQEHPGLAHEEGQTRFVLALALHLQGKTEEAREHASAAKSALEVGEPGSRYDLPQIEAFLLATAP
jgi:serine/threonine protein kinase/tetratricopeptide (TPR) repeat protein